ncbi:MAG: hypothetical protein KatS3mg102_2175 [Planctomycetota bacterium]|nr:MAG: hypothetical protein KatS3mg102_2175 [Planctomycetota bacterium]
MPLGEELVISELRVPAGLVGRTLAEAALPRRFGVTVVAQRRGGAARSAVVQPDPHVPLVVDDTLIVVGRPEALGAMLEAL